MRPRVNGIKRQLARGESALGINVQTASPEIVEMVGIAGYDYVMIDWEHGSFGTETVVSMIRAAEAVDITPIVRVPDHSETSIKRVLDAGAMGVVVPQIDTLKQAQEAIAAAIYFDGHNNGARGACPSIRATGHLSPDWKSFTLESNRDVFVAVGIESQEGIANLGDIVQIPGLDAIFLGTFDLAHSMGKFGNTKDAEAQSALDALVAAAKSRPLPLFATLISDTLEEVGAEQKRWERAGARVFNVMSDRRLVTMGLRARLANCRAALSVRTTTAA
jgi:4-hydroxy-2-oxoheptanedioate aldolase